MSRGGSILVSAEVKKAIFFVEIEIASGDTNAFARFGNFCLSMKESHGKTSYGGSFQLVFELVTAFVGLHLEPHHIWGHLKYFKAFPI